jgi:hypothetical protein
MTLEELKEALEDLMPGASYTTSPRGEIIIHSNLTEDEDLGELVDMDSTDEDFDFDRDTESYDEVDEDDEEE